MEQTYDPFIDRCLGWELKFAWFPEKCHITEKKIWLKYAYRGTAMYRTGDITFAYEYRWHDKIEHIIWQLKK